VTVQELIVCEEQAHTVSTVEPSAGGQADPRVVVEMDALLDMGQSSRIKLHAGRAGTLQHVHNSLTRMCNFH